METIQALFIAVAVLGTLLFMLTRRRFDYFSLAYFSSLIYFMPGFVGSTSYSISGRWEESPLHPEAFAIMIFVMLSIVMAERLAHFSPGLVNWRIRIRGLSLLGPILSLAAVAGLTGLLLTSGRTVFETDKALVLDSLGRWHILYYCAATLGLAMAYELRQRMLFVLFLAMLGFDLFIGFRSALAVALLSVLILLLSAQKEQRLSAMNWRIALGILMFGILMFGYAHLAFAVKSRMWDLAWNTLADPDAFLFFFIRSEPFIVQQTLNEVVTNRFHTNFDHIASALYQFMLFAPELGANTVSFNSVFQPALFPEVDYGLASNIWAQMWSAGGWPLLIVFSMLFNIVLAIGNTFLRSPSPILRAGLAPVFCYWAFYIHRNDLGYILNLEKRHVLLLLGAIAVASLVRAATRIVPHRQHF
jgi:hypothetical protein